MTGNTPAPPLAFCLRFLVNALHHATELTCHSPSPYCPGSFAAAATRLGVGGMDGSHSNAVAHGPSESTPSRVTSSSQLPPGLRGAMMPRLFIQRVDVGALVVRGTIQGYIPGQQVCDLLSSSCSARAQEPFHRVSS